MAGIVESDGFLSPGRTCDFGRLRPLALHRVPPAGFTRGVLRGDGFGDEYGGGRSRGLLVGRGEEGEKVNVCGTSEFSQNGDLSRLVF